ncbi:unnamed protein product [Spirodela intermedia]|uniref:Enoyl reductase (ER) domain-containing protein n=1 Tax=Spirodela intermedia TaxID=51605 RepID=A0A7I8JCK0_SPIIN|nr:unnamed protein product [Spirodela intermedia]CAA6667918.1 unnamed protein product [Spirodela intermedia]
MAAKLMRAVQYDRYGGGGAALKLVEVSIPSPKKGQLLLKVEATSLNPADWKIQKGMLRPFFHQNFPSPQVIIPPIIIIIIFGTCVAGEVVEVGQGVTAFKAGDKVITLLHFTVAGGLAEYAAAEEKLTVHRPAGISAAEGSGIPIAGLTALHSLRSLGINLDGVDKPINVLVTAASGGIGHYAVQLLKLAKPGAGEESGADEVLDYKSPGGAALESPTGRKYDAVVNCVAGIPWSTLKANLAAGGKVADVAATAGDMLRAALQKVCFCNKRRFPLISTPDGPGLEFLVGQMMEGKLRTVVDSKFPLKRAAEGFDKSIEGHATGKIVVEIF